MKSRPLPVIIVALLFILTGSAGLVYHIKDYFSPDYTWYGVSWVLLLRITAIACGFLLLYQVNWARWLAIVWLGYHVAIGALHSTAEMIAHIVFLIIVSVLLYLPVSSVYFKRPR